MTSAFIGRTDEPPKIETKTFEFVSDFATVLVTVQGQEDWSDEIWDSVSNDELDSVVRDAKLFYLNECYLDG
jgi:hypothetical protein